MSLFQALVMGIVQGATEYIPVSSSAHLVLVPWLLGWPDAPFTFEVLVQWGTLVGVFTAMLDAGLLVAGSTGFEWLFVFSEAGRVAAGALAGYAAQARSGAD